jgi:hypothetical protein
MAEVSGIKQALIQAQALERVQEAARRQGEMEQQSFSLALNRQVDQRGHQVNEGAKLTQEELDPNSQKKHEEEKPPREADEGVEEGAEPKSEEEMRGRHIDTRA